MNYTKLPTKLTNELIKIRGELSHNDMGIIAKRMKVTPNHLSRIAKGKINEQQALKFIAEAKKLIRENS